MKKNLLNYRNTIIGSSNKTFSIILADESQTLKLGHQNFYEDTGMIRYIEMSAAKEILVKLKEAYKKLAMQLGHFQEVARLKALQAVQSRKMRELYNQRINYHSSSASKSQSQYTSEQGSTQHSQSSSPDGTKKDGINSRSMGKAFKDLKVDNPTSHPDLIAINDKIVAQAERYINPYEIVIVIFNSVKSLAKIAKDIKAQVLASQREELEAKGKSSTARVNDLCDGNNNKLIFINISEQGTEMLSLRETQEIEVSEINAVFQRESQMQQAILDTEYKALIERKLMNSLLNNVIDAVINIDTVGTITKYNQSAERIFGWLASEMIGKNIKLLMPLRFAVDHDSYLLRYATTGVKRFVGKGASLHGLKKDGTEFPMYISLSEVKQESLHTFTGIIRDLTEEVALKEKFQKEEDERQLTHQALVNEMHKFKDQAGALIRNILPDEVAEDLMNGVQTLPQSYAQATVFFCDVAGFSEITRKSTPEQVVSTLNDIFTGMDTVNQPHFVK